MRDLLHAIGLVHVAVAVALGLLYTWIWFRTPHRFPRYVHVLAVIALLLGCLPFVADSSLLTPAKVPSVLLLIVVLPTLVYAAFIFYGGVHVASTDRRNGTSSPHGET